MADKLRSRIIQLNETSYKPPTIKHETRELLIEYFYSANRELERLIQRDLSHWDSNTKGRTKMGKA